MPSIPSRIYPLPAQSSSSLADEPEDPIDIFSMSLPSGTLFPDYAITSHGDPGGRIGYTSPRFGEVVLNIPVHPDEEVGRRLFAHYLWNAAAIAAAAIEQGSSVPIERQRGWWDCRGSKVLEVGAGTALPSLIAALSSANSIYITDHPASPALTSGSIVSNVQQNLFPLVGNERNIATQQPERTSKTKSHIKVLPHVWGQLEAESCRDLKNSFDKIIVADCLWMSSQHDNLITSILHFLRPVSNMQGDLSPGFTPSASTTENQLKNPTSTSSALTKPCAYVVAGFHTGRQIPAWFLEKAIARGLIVEEIWEVDVDLVDGSESPRNHTITSETQDQFQLGDILQDGITGLRRPWLPKREGESKEDSRKWCVVAILTKSEEKADDGPGSQEHIATRMRQIESGSHQPTQVVVDDSKSPSEGTLEVDNTGWV